MKKVNKFQTLDLSMLITLVSDLKEKVETMGALSFSDLKNKDKVNEYILQLAEAAGVASFIAKEATLLSNDTHKLTDVISQYQGLAQAGMLDLSGIEELPHPGRGYSN